LNLGFKLKYHPEDSVKRRDEQRSALKRRIEVFQKFLNEGKLDSVSVDSDQSDSLVKLLDSVVILLEGGSDFDLQALDKDEEEKAQKDNEDEKKNGEGAKKEADSKEGGANGDAAAGATAPVSEEQKQLQQKAKEYLESNGAGAAAGAAADGEKASRKRKRTKEFGGGSSDGSSSEEEAEDDLPPGMDKKPEKEDKEKDKESKKEDAEPKKEDDAADEKKEKMEEDKKSEEPEEGEEKKADDNGVKPRPLHKVTSIFLRNLSPTITKQEVEAMCKRYPGFLRAAIADPQPERRWFRRGWITFERDVKIKEICFNLNNIRLRECELGPIVNRDLQRRIRSTSGITVDKKVVRNDIKIAAKVITNLDKRWNLWESEEDKEGDEKKEAEKKEEDAVAANLGLSSNNPILANITDYLIEEASAEEEELLGKNNDLEDGEEGEEGNSVTRDAELIKVLDRLLFYLRIVHSVDFYNHSEYPNEDEMPNRCGIMHARGIPPTSNVTQIEIEEYCNTFCKKMGSFVQPRGDLSDEEASKLGMKNEDDEVEKFVQANTQELGKDKWLCPLSGKKFKGPDFVRKHIFNKHGEKVEEVKKEVKYYNSYLKDPKRPQQYEMTGKVGGGGGGGHGSSAANGRDAGGRSAPEGRHRDPYHYGGFPREATNYPVFDDTRDRERGYNEPRYGSMDRGHRGGYGGGRGGGGRGDHGGGRGRGIRDRIGGPSAHHFPPARATAVHGAGRPDPRGVIDYGDVDFNMDSDIF